LKSVASEDGAHGYSGYRGTPIFAEQLLNTTKSVLGLRFDPETEVLPLIGSKEGIVNLCLSVFE
jgi:aspartate/methionine/tyrosine aminotransferase